jgi:hypothetical protein
MHPQAHKEASMTLDDIDGSDVDQFPLGQEASDWDEDDLGLVWEETEIQRLASQFGVDRFALH